LQYRGESLGRYIRNKKLDSAARDLRETDENIYSIGLRYGYDSQQTFTRLFPQQVFLQTKLVCNKAKNWLEYQGKQRHLNLLSDSPGKAAADKSMRRDLSKNRKTDSAEKTKPPVL
jgi:AraC-like DNA-binding protein